MRPKRRAISAYPFTAPGTATESPPHREARGSGFPPRRNMSPAAPAGAVSRKSMA